MLAPTCRPPLSRWRLSGFKLRVREVDGRAGAVHVCVPRAAHSHGSDAPMAAFCPPLSPSFPHTKKLTAYALSEGVTSRWRPWTDTRTVDAPWAAAVATERREEEETGAACMGATRMGAGPAGPAGRAGRVAERMGRGARERSMVDGMRVGGVGREGRAGGLGKKSKGGGRESGSGLAHSFFRRGGERPPDTTRQGSRPPSSPLCS